jgi:type VI secretion system secreted protein VgrG
MAVQTLWPIQLTTPLGTDVLIPEGYTASEGVSRMYSVQVDAVASNSTSVSFDKLLGQSVTVEVKRPAGGTSRFWNGIVNRVAQRGRTTEYVIYKLEIVPKLWLLTREAGSRIFQQKSVPDILKQVLSGINVSYQLMGTYEPRDYCVQYRETDFNFVSRLMEDEGIYYFFKHASGSHQMVIADSPAGHPDLGDGGKLLYDEVRSGARKEDRIHVWEKNQEIRSGKVTLWDYTFELPDKNLEADKIPQEDVTIGKSTVKLKLGVSDPLEQYDYPGGYAHRFDGVSPGGGERSSDTQKIFSDNKRTVGIRMQEDTAQSLIFHAESNCREVVSGHKFELEEHFSDDAKYVVVSAEHSASHPIGTERNQESFQYANRFECIPHAIPFRPERTTPVPTVRGAQTAVVVGPSGEEIFTDKYGRIKVQFHWDRVGKNDADSSCWLRVATPWAGKQWGMVHIPRLGQEVIVAFLEGDPDQPIVVGSTYNADQMPPYTLPANKTQSGIKSRSSKGGGSDNFNEIRFEDNKGQEQLFVHAEKDMATEVEHDETRDVGNDRTTTIKNNETLTVKQGNQTSTLEQGNQSLTIKMGNQSNSIQMGNQSTKLDLGKSETEAMQSIELKVGQSSVKLDQMGVTIKGMMIKIEGQIQVEVKSVMTQVNGDAMLIAKGGIVMIN